MDKEIRLHSIEEALADLAAGRIVIVTDDEDRENEGDLVALADRVTPETVNFMIRYGRGLLCAPITGSRAAELGLRPMTERNTDAHGTAFTVSVDHQATTTGISAIDRSRTIRELCSAQAQPADFRRPGHVFPLIARPGGVLERPGHTEASVDLAKLCGAYPAALICEVVGEDGEMARLPELFALARRHGLKLIAIRDLIRYRQMNEPLVKREAEIDLPTSFGSFRTIAYSNEADGKEHLAIVKGQPDGSRPVLVRVHSECLTGDVFQSRRCDCGEQLALAMERIESAGEGVLLYMRQEGRGIGLLNKLKAYELQERGLDTVEANLALGFPPDARNYAVAAQMLKDLGLREIKLLTNNPHKCRSLEQYGVRIAERLPLTTEPNASNWAYLETKERRMGHILTAEAPAARV
ncbi:bifunctional 3,4-dihydroxy-2-butanone-4-phosphate synthase/GTP cyclohydrolase II [Cohnella lubricantis]|uniref:Riboflavin biosynthesis protein RibBA n=1 Tax=Cohnella lubricantis TaxID=2163172 RepID=A0A841TFZ8_9BACL|nr:bifunctional 3,4-dihydroxy-2-butanone-4-phosphate synthase/GTP cyclohydrolase II [Cohnella lubricantis]MBB6678198.1 bifunctional 3,4-dihydroxy-2-butanone-4-phosphate synthase/GTP cyclohydrolase II [Cohnella lubricantis]MBP2119675.1 3,4-dihydroxy 2-butanone 4-phosphate synthase/GTP cyclohydrolase II [Cohnella lubricantis]